MMEFTEQQLEYLAEIFALPCCHVSGMHDPTHYEKGLVCESQMAKAWKHAMKALGLEPTVKSQDGCYWCSAHEGYPENKDVQPTVDVLKDKREEGDGL